MIGGKGDARTGWAEIRASKQGSRWQASRPVLVMGRGVEAFGLEVKGKRQPLLFRRPARPKTAARGTFFWRLQAASCKPVRVGLLLVWQLWQIAQGGLVAGPRASSYCHIRLCQARHEACYAIGCCTQAPSPSMDAARSSCIFPLPHSFLDILAATGLAGPERLSISSGAPLSTLSTLSRTETIHVAHGSGRCAPPAH